MSPQKKIATQYHTLPQLDFRSIGIIGASPALAQYTHVALTRFAVVHEFFIHAGPACMLEKLFYLEEIGGIVDVTDATLNEIVLNLRYVILHNKSDCFIIYHYYSLLRR